MAKTDYKSIDQYIAAQPEAVQPVLGRVRAAIAKALPGAEEAISYQIPAFKCDGRVVIFFAAWKQHFSVYPATDRVLSALQIELQPYEVSRGTIRFPLSDPVPVRLIQRIARLRAEEQQERAKTKAKTKTRAKAAARSKL